MARDHARIRLNIWDDEDFAELSSSAQWLYFRILSHQTLSYCGVADWRPGRYAASAADLTPTDVETFAAELERGRFVVIDRDTEEVLVRSFVKHDELMDKWNMAAAVARTWSEVASKPIKAVIVHELHRLMESGADGKWDRDDVERVMKRKRMTPDEALASTRPNPTQCPSHWPNDCPSDCPFDEAILGAGNGGAVLPSPFSPLPDPKSPSSRLDLLRHQGDEDDGDEMMPLRAEGGRF